MTDLLKILFQCLKGTVIKGGPLLLLLKQKNKHIGMLYVLTCLLVLLNCAFIQHKSFTI